MFMSLSDRTKSFIVFCAVLALATGNVIFAMDWVSEPEIRRTAATVGLPNTIILRRPLADAPGPLAPTPKVSAQTNAPAAPAAAAPAQCDVAACAAAYRTFRESDCSYQPSLNERRLCTKGRPPQ
jgi:hypothetical protein